MCLDARAMGREFLLFARRPGAASNRRADIVTPDGPGIDVTESAPESSEALVTIVDIYGPLESRAGYHEVCGGWSDGHDAVAERMIAALAVGDVVMRIDSPGGAVSGLQAAVDAVLATKKALGRKVYAHGELIASAAYWWAACVADEIHVPALGQIGSVGACGSHMSVASALADAGVAPTFFAWPGPGKVAFAPELPLSDIGRERGDRDVAIAGEAFCAAVTAARSGLTRDAIVELDADCLTGEAAVVAGLADSVASFDDVLTLALAATAEDRMSTQAGESYEKTTKTTETFEKDDEEKDDGAEAEESPDSERAQAAAEPPPEDDDEEDDDEAAKAEAKAASEKSANAQAASLASLAGLPEGSSTPAIKAALIPLVGLARHAMALTEAKTPGEARGALKALAEDAAAAGVLRTDLAAAKRKVNARERMDLLRKLSAANLPGYARGDLFVDVVDDATGKRTVKAAPVFAEMKLSTLRGLVESKLKHAGTTAASPYSPSKDDARTAAETAKVERAAETPFVRQIATRSTASPEQLARTAAALEAQGAK